MHLLTRKASGPIAHRVCNDSAGANGQTATQGQKSECHEKLQTRCWRFEGRFNANYMTSGAHLHPEQPKAINAACSPQRLWRRKVACSEIRHQSRARLFIGRCRIPSSRQTAEMACVLMLFFDHLATDIVFNLVEHSQQKSSIYRSPTSFAPHSNSLKRFMFSQ